MELGTRLRCCHPPPNTYQPPGAPSATSAGAWPRSGRLAVALGRPRPRRAGALRVAAPDDSRPLGATIYTNSIGQATKLRADKFFQVEMTVRDCEIDQYGVVNNAVYAEYIEKAREELATFLGFSRGSIVRTGKAMALSELNLKYFAPLKRGDRFVVMVRVVQMKGARMLIEHLVETLPEHKLVLEAAATVVCLNKDYRPTRVFPEMASRLLHFFSS